MISVKIIEKLYIYFVFLMIGLNLKIFQGLYIYNLLIIIYLLFNYNKISFYKNVIIFIAIYIISLCVPLIVQIFYIDEYNISSFYIIFNIFIFISFISFLSLIKDININYNIVLFFLSLPIFLSIIMFINKPFENLMLNFYHIHRYPAFGRYGGVFGSDVNAFGLYNSIIIFFLLILKRYYLINRIFVSIVGFISLLGILLSGMRTGIIVLFVLLMLFNWKLKLIKIKDISFMFILILATMFFMYQFNDFVKDIINYLIDRFSISHLINDFHSGDNGGNLRQAIQYFNETVKNYSFNSINTFFGLDSTLNYVDNYYIFSFLKHGLLNVITIFILFFLIIFQYKRNIFNIFVLLMTFLFAIKGIFIINNFYMLVILYSIFLWRKYENSYHS